MDPNACLVCNNPGPGLHRFPREKKRFVQWLKSINREDLLENEDESNVYKNGKVCNSHFAAWCFVGKDKKKLGKHAAPNHPSPPTMDRGEAEASESTSEPVTAKTVDPHQGNYVKKSSDSEVTPKICCEPSNEDSSNKNNSDDNNQDKSKPVVSGDNTHSTASKQQRTHVKKKKVTRDENQWNRRNLSDNEMTAERVIGATKNNGKLLLLIKWKDCDEADLVPSTIANRKFPEKVIEYYESRLKWDYEEHDDKENLDYNNHIIQ